MLIKGNRVKIKPLVCYSNPALNLNTVYTISGIFYNFLGGYKIYFLKGTDLFFREEDLILLEKPKLELE